jgi:hypothetical protein
MGFFVLKRLQHHLHTLTRCCVLRGSVCTATFCVVVQCLCLGVLLPESLLAEDNMGYRMEEENVVFIFQPQLYSQYSTRDGVVKKIENLNITSVAVGCEVNAWSVVEWRMNKINAYWYELRVPYSIFEKKTQWEFKFFVNNEYWVEPASGMTNIVPISAGGQNTTKRYNLVATIPQPAVQQFTFRLSGFPDARAVYLAGTFNDWNPRATPMMRKGNEWTVALPLKPMGYSYKFIVDGVWKLDPANPESVDDGAGHTNSFLAIPSLSGSTQFILNGYGNAKKVAVGGTFNGWNPERHYFAKQQTTSGIVWTCRLNIHPGYYEYRFWVDGEPMRDPLKTLTTKNEYGEDCSVLLLPSREGNVEFVLKGYNTAKTVALAGTFNDWSSRRHLFFRQGDQWVCRIRLKQGSYKYKFVVDGEWILDPENKQVVENEFGSGNNALTVK